MATYHVTVWCKDPCTELAILPSSRSFKCSCKLALWLRNHLHVETAVMLEIPKRDRINGQPVEAAIRYKPDGPWLDA